MLTDQQASCLTVNEQTHATSGPKLTGRPFGRPGERQKMQCVRRTPCAESSYTKKADVNVNVGLDFAGSR
jgi:hypothetical protein